MASEFGWPGGKIKASGFCRVNSTQRESRQTRREQLTVNYWTYSGESGCLSQMISLVAGLPSLAIEGSDPQGESIVGRIVLNAVQYGE
jgi:hypothetical protein